MAENFSISICVPALNEAGNLREAVLDLLSTLSGLVREIEIIVVDDGSADSTPQIAGQLSKEYPQVKIIRHEKNAGVGVCYRDALKAASGDYYTWFPADNENSASGFVQYLPYLGKDTVVLAHHRGQDPRPITRRCMSYFYTWVLNKYYGSNLKYYNGLAIFPTSLLRSFPLAAKGFFFSAENLIYAVMGKYKIIELTAPLKKRAGGKSKALTFTSLYRMITELKSLLKIKSTRK